MQIVIFSFCVIAFSAGSAKEVFRTAGLGFICRSMPSGRVP